MRSFKKAGLGMSLAAALFCVFAFVQGEEKTLLRLALKKGKTYSFDNKMDMNMDMSGQAMNVNMGMGYNVTVTEVRKDEQVVDFTYSKFKMNMPMVPGMTFDSENPAPNSPLTKQFGQVAGAKFSIVLTTDGKVKEVNGLQELSERIGGADNPVLGQLVNEEQFRSQLEQSFNFLPNKPVGVGDTWQKEQNVAGQMPMTLVATYKVKSITKSKVTLDVTGTLKSDASGVALPGMEGVSMAGNMTGTMELEKETSFPLSSTMNMNVTATKDGVEILKMKTSNVNTGKVN